MIPEAKLIVSYIHILVIIRKKLASIIRNLGLYVNVVVMWLNLAEW